jgi:hypothetical protein
MAEEDIVQKVVITAEDPILGGRARSGRHGGRTIPRLTDGVRLPPWGRGPKFLYADGSLTL